MNWFTGDPIFLCATEIEIHEFFFLPKVTPCGLVVLDSPWLLRVAYLVDSPTPTSLRALSHHLWCPSQAMATAFTIKIGQESIMSFPRELTAAKHISLLPSV